MQDVKQLLSFHGNQSRWGKIFTTGTILVSHRYSHPTTPREGRGVREGGREGREREEGREGRGGRGGGKEERERERGRKASGSDEGGDGGMEEGGVGGRREE